MKRLGIFSGKVYDCDAEDIKECAILINDMDAADPEVVKIRHSRYKNKCAGCGGCPMSLEAAGVKHNPYAEIGGMNIELVLKELIPAVHTAGFMEGNGKISIENDDEFTEFVVEHFDKWYSTGREIGFEEYICEKLLAKYNHANEEV